MTFSLRFQSFVTTCIYVATASVVVSVSTGNYEVLTKSNGLFSTQLYNAVSTGNENLLISPLSLNYGLTVVSLGTDGNTLKQVRTVLNQPNDNTAIVSSYHAFSDSTKNSEYVKVAIKMYVDNAVKLKEQFKNDLIKDFEDGIENVDFANNPKGSVDVINSFVDNKTNHLIPKLFDEGSVSKDTVSIIINTLYFNSPWKIPFPKRFTEKKKFYGLKQEYEVEMMVRRGRKFKYAEDAELGVQLVELPYEGEYSFFIILPINKTGITEVENKIKSKITGINSSPFTDIFRKTEREDVNIYLPKFKFEQTHHLRSALEQMGITDMFTTNANFEKLSTTPVFVTDVIQKTYISVSENGTEAAAGTGFSIVPLSSYYPAKEPYEFIADHPFIYMIVHKQSETPLFIGRYMNP